MAKIWFGCNNRDENGWVVDFGGLRPITDILKAHYDHSLCMAADDPIYEAFLPLAEAGAVDLKCMKEVGIEAFASHVMDTVNGLISEQTNGRCWVDRVEVFEHEKNSAICSTMVTTPRSPSCPVTSNDQQPKESEKSEEPGQQTKTVASTSSPRVRRPAQVGNVVSDGKSDWFKGTSWSQ